MNRIRRICALLLVIASQSALAEISSCVGDSAEIRKNRLPVPASGNAVPKTLGVVAFERRKFDLAYQELSKLPSKDMQAQYYLGVMSEQGLGTAKSVQGAMRWYLRAAEMGSAQAQLALGKMFSSGADLPKNYGEAATWLRRSAEQGLGESQLLLGLMYSNGIGQLQDRPCALAWVGLAADARAEGASAAQQEILKRMTSEERARALELKSQLQTKIGQKAE